MRIKYLPFFKEIFRVFLFFEIGSQMSIMVPIGQMYPQKKRPKKNVLIINETDNNAVVIIVRYAMLMTIKTNGSNWKNRFWYGMCTPYRF